MREQELRVTVASYYHAETQTRYNDRVFIPHKQHNYLVEIDSKYKL